MKSFLGNSILNELEKTRNSSTETMKSVPFQTFCDVVYSLGTKHISKESSHELIVDLLSECMNKMNPKLEVYMLLKFLIPKQDHLSVYGFKTVRLIKLLGLVLSKQGRTEDAAALANFLKSPPLQESLLKKEGIVSLPELKIASVMCSKPQSKQQYSLSLQDIGLFCKKLTEGYICVSSSELDSFQVEAWLEIAPFLSFEEWVCLIRIVLKKISMGIGMISFLRQIPCIEADDFFKKQFSLEKLALNIVLHYRDPTSVWKRQIPHLVCGTPFVPMTCHSLKSPYLFQWMFSSEENTDGKFIAPKDGRLVISSANDSWYIPMSHNAKQKTFVSIHERNAMHNRSRREHIKLLHELRRRRLLRVECCYGLVIHYTLSWKQQGIVIFLIRNISDAKEQNIQLFNNDENDMDVEKAKNEAMDLNYDFTKQKNIENIVSQIKRNEEKEEAPEHGQMQPMPEEVSAAGKEKTSNVSIVVETAFDKNIPQEKTRINATFPRRANVTPQKSKTPMLASNKKEKSKIKLEDVQLVQKNKKSTENSLNDEDDAEKSTANLKGKKSAANENNERMKAIVQLKYDGDRIQIHVQRNSPSGEVEYKGRNIVEFRDSEDVVEIKSSTLKSLQENSDVYGIKVQLFTKWGKNVTELYSTIQYALENNKELKMYAPCVFDAELILVNEKSEPLPWYSEKWRYNNNSTTKNDSAVTESLSKILEDVSSAMPSPPKTENIILFSHEIPLETGSGDGTLNLSEEMGTSTLNNDADNEEGGEALVFGIAQGVKRWSGIGINDLSCLRGREIKDSTIHLQCVIFDILMHEEREVHQLCYKDRLQILDGIYKKKVFKEKEDTSSFPYIRIISDSVLVDKVQELQSILKHVTEKRWEGLVIKDPRSSYAFGKTGVIQKLKISGPDINTSVIGCGFSFSKNPRQWGFLCGVSLTKEGRGIEVAQLSYCRVEYIEGESPWRQLIEIVNARSTIKTSTLFKPRTFYSGGGGLKNNNMKGNVLKRNSINRTKDEHDVIELEHCTVHILKYKNDNGLLYYKINWNYIQPEQYDLNYCMYISKQHLIDIQWLTNPLECPFQLSVRGDLDPLQQQHYVVMHMFEKEKKIVDLCVPRNAVGRIEWKEMQHSECDDAKSITEKFESHRAWEFLLQRGLVQSITKLRKISHSSDQHLQLARKMMLGFQMYMSAKKKVSDGQQQQEWPQIPPKAQFSLLDYDQLIKNVNELLPPPTVVPHVPPLSKKEKLILLKIPQSHEPQKDWKLPSQSGIFTEIVSQSGFVGENEKNHTEGMEQESFERERRKSQLEKLTKRLQVLQKQFIDNDEKIVTVHTGEKFLNDECFSNNACEFPEARTQCAVFPYFMSYSEEEGESDGEVELNDKREEMWDYLPAEGNKNMDHDPITGMAEKCYLGEEAATFPTQDQ